VGAGGMDHGIVMGEGAEGDVSVLDP
jgi:hypothetical protein